MASLASSMEILRAFSPDRAELSVTDLAEIVGTPSSTVYRTVKDLSREGLLARSREGYYRIGTAVLAYERVLRLTDPTVRLGQQLIADVVAQAGLPCRGLVCCLHGNQVMCVADAAAGAPDFTSSYERGRPMPLLRGASSKVILAMMPPRSLRKTLAGVDTDAELGDELRAIRRSGFRISHEEVDLGLVGIGVPFKVDDPPAVGSLSLVIAAAASSAATGARLAGMLVAARTIFEDALRAARSATRERGVPGNVGFSLDGWSNE